MKLIKNTNFLSVHVAIFSDRLWFDEMELSAGTQVNILSRDDVLEQFPNRKFAKIICNPFGRYPLWGFIDLEDLQV